MKTRDIGKGRPCPSRPSGSVAWACLIFTGRERESGSLGTLNHALDVGVTFWDTADMYGLGENERLLGKVLGKRRDEVTLATKFGVVRNSAQANSSV